MDKLEEKALEFRPKMIICGASAYPREWDYKRFRWGWGVGGGRWGVGEGWGGGWESGSVYAAVDAVLEQGRGGRLRCGGV